MVAPLLGAAARGVARGAGRKEGAEAREKRAASRIQRTRDQEQARLSQARLVRQSNKGVLTQSMRRPAGNDNFEEAPANDNEEGRGGENPRLLEAQERVSRLRALSRARQQKVTPKKEKSAFNYLVYIPAFCVAFFKDILDFVGIGSLPAIGWLVSFMAGTIIFILLLATDSQVSLKTARRILTRFFILVVTAGVEGIFFGVNLFPFQTAAVAIIFIIEMMQAAGRKIVKEVKKVTAGAPAQNA